MKRPAALWSVESDAKVIRSLSTVPKDAWRDEPCKKEYAGCRRYPSAWRETEQEAAFACDQRVSAAPFMCLKGRGLSEGVAGVDADAVTLAECAGSGADPELTWVLTTLTKDIEWKKPVFGGSYLQHRHLQPYSDSSVWRLHNEGGANLKSGTYDAKWPLKVQHMPAPCLVAVGVCPRRVLRAALCALCPCTCVPTCACDASGDEETTTVPCLWRCQRCHQRCQQRLTNVPVSLRVLGCGQVTCNSKPGGCKYCSKGTKGNTCAFACDGTCGTEACPARPTSTHIQ